MKFEEIAKGVWIIEPEIHSDSRGYLYESYRADEFQKRGLSANFQYEKEGLIPVGEVELGEAGYLIALTSGRGVVKVREKKIEIPDKNQVYIEKGMKCSIKITEEAHVILKSEEWYEEFE